MLDILAEEMNRETVRYAASRAIFCPYCDRVLDARRTVLVSSERSALVCCGECWDRAWSNMTGADQARILAECETLDGRELYSRRKARAAA